MDRRKANSFIKKILYQLKKLNGQTVDLYIRGTVSQDPGTGLVNYPETRWRIRRAPFIPDVIQRSELQQPPFATAGRQAEFGGYFVVGDSLIIVDYKDLPKNYKANMVDNFVICHERYQIKSAEPSTQLQGVLFTVRKLSGQRVNEIFEIRDKFTLTETMTSV